jgi:hypothetical protein
MGACAVDRPVANHNARVGLEHRVALRAIKLSSYLIQHVLEDSSKLPEPTHSIFISLLIDYLLGLSSLFF